MSTGFEMTKNIAFGLNSTNFGIMSDKKRNYCIK